MRHQAQVSHFGRKSGHRKSLIRGLVYSLVQHGRIKTTLAKAKELRRHADRAVTLAKKGGLHARRLLLARYPNPGVVDTLMANLGPDFKERNGGYTRILKLGPRPGDNAHMAFIEWVNFEVKGDSTEAQVDETGEVKKSAKAKSSVKKGRSKAASKAIPSKSKKASKAE